MRDKNIILSSNLNVDELIKCILSEPEDIRWKIARELSKLEDDILRRDITNRIEETLEEVGLNFFETQKLKLVETVLNYERVEIDFDISEKIDTSSPTIDFHIHPKRPDGEFLRDLKEAGIDCGVIMATDTDREDIYRDEINEWFVNIFNKSDLRHQLPLDRALEITKESLYSKTHVTNRDVYDWIQDYPDKLIGFGSVNLSKDEKCVEKTLNEIRDYKFRGIKLLPFSQFFNPSTNENILILMEFCKEEGLIVLSHTGCAAGVFEYPEFSLNSRPAHWDSVIRGYPEVPLVLAHFGSYSSYVPNIWLAEAIELMEKYENVYADLAAVPLLLDIPWIVEEIRDRVGFDRVLFGSDYPITKQIPEGLKLSVLKIKDNPHLTEIEKNQILGINAAKLLDLK